MKNYTIIALFILSFIFSISSIAKCKNVYTIGAYDKAFANHVTVTKLGPLSAAVVPSIFPKSFLEKDGSYGGGEAFCTIKKACLTLTHQINTGILPKNEKWHIYILDADWNHDTYKLHANDFRIKHLVKVIKRVRENC